MIEDENEDDDDDGGKNAQFTFAHFKSQGQTLNYLSLNKI